ncbi:MAG: hypothetical protein KDD61_04755 [Bdellovibrionales bacterium]|nr:hypothetical protein [Bdellovibrionales bacterium]
MNQNLDFEPDRRKSNRGEQATDRRNFLRPTWRLKAKGVVIALLFVIALLIVLKALKAF